MAYAQPIDQKISLIDHALAAFRAIGKGLEQRRSFTRTRNELSALSDYNLADLGLTRADIDRVSLQSVIGSAH